MQRRNLLAAVAAGAAGLALLAWAFSPRPLDVETAQVRQGLFEQAIEEDCRTRLKERYTVSAPVAARLSRIALREGDQVQAGDTVAVLAPLMPSMVDERSTREATARLKGAAAGTERAAARVARAGVALEEARLELRRTEMLAGEGFVAPSRLDAARLSSSAAQRELEMARAEREVAAQEQAQAAAMLQPASEAQRTGRPLPVRSPVSGAVLRVVLPSEGVVAAGAALLEIGDRDGLEVVCELLTADAVLAQPGRRVVMDRWGGPRVDGRVRRVEPSAFTKVSALGIEEQRVKVLIDVDAPPQAWQAVGDGFRVTSRIVTASTGGALLVPAGALFQHGDGMAVYRAGGRRAALQAVEVAARNGSEAMVRSGLAAGDRVVIYPPPALTDGRRIRLRAP
ncbi:MAG: efflux RND transporter periplasmic adaptor subunit [Comamonadaceae bacterium]|nr:MAG: efflux RND transporter periplasmic adaptor subunit [Comamonadaceae bacterium]